MTMLDNFTSLPPNEERQFHVYEQTMIDNQKKAWTFAGIAAAAAFILAVGIYFGVTPEKKVMIDEEDMQGLQRTKKDEPRPTPPPPAEAPAAAPAAEAAPAAAEGAAPAAAEGAAAPADPAAAPK
jgi:hypothetical protein